MNHSWRNWAGNQTCCPKAMYSPESEEEIIEIVHKYNNSHEVIRVSGNSYSWAPLISGADVIISLNQYNKILGYDTNALTITCQAGISLRDLALYAVKLGWSLPNASFCDMQSMGAIATTSTHACGWQNPILASYIKSCRLVLSNGNVLDINYAHPDMPAIRASLGMLGIISTITYQCIPQCSVISEQKLVPDEIWMNDFVSRDEECDFYNVFWLPHTGVGLTLNQRKISNTALPLRATNSRYWDRQMRPWLSYLHRVSLSCPKVTPICNKMMTKLFFRDRRIEGLLNEVLCGTFSFAYRQYSCEYAFPINRAMEVVKTIKLKTDRKNLYLPAFFDIRSIAEDNTLLGLAYNERVITVGCNILTQSEKIPKVLTEVEAIYKDYSGRPHLTKVYSDNTEIKDYYPGLKEFEEIRQKYDPTNLFITPTLKELFS